MFYAMTVIMNAVWIFKMTMLKLARKLSKEYHAGQVDKAGEDYFTGHITRVVNAVETEDEKIVAYLHDILDDTPMTMKMLDGMGFNDDVLFAVGRLSHYSLTYNQRISRLTKTRLGRVVKLADLKDHLRDTSSIPDSLIKRYEKALKILGE